MKLVELSEEDLEFIQMVLQFFLDSYKEDKSISSRAEVGKLTVIRDKCESL